MKLSYILTTKLRIVGISCENVYSTTINIQFLAFPMNFNKFK